MNKKKPEPKPSVFKRQILRSANSYTDDKIEELLKLIELSEDTEPGDGESKEESSSPRPPIRDISDVGKITSVKFQEESGEFTYDTTKKYGSMYLSSDGSLTATVTVEVDGEGEIEDYEIQVTIIV